MSLRIILFLIMVLSLNKIIGQSPTGDYPFTTLSRPSLLEIDGAWQDDKGQTYTIPIQFQDKNEIALQQVFYLDSLEAETLFLYFEGLSWKVEIELNDYYLGVFDKPFARWHLALENDWLQEGQNTLRLTFGPGLARPYYPALNLCMLKAPLLVEQGQLDVLLQNPMPAIEVADTVGLIAPYYFEKGFQFDVYQASLSLLSLREQGIEYIYFAFPPGRELQALAAQMGFTEVLSAEAISVLAPVNAYPYDGKPLNFALAFWLDQEGYRTKAYSMLTQLTGKRPVETAPMPKGIISFLVLIPLFCMSLIKVLSVGYFSALPGLLLSPKLFIDTVKDLSSGNQAFMIVLHFIKGLLLVCAVSMAIFYIQRENQWHITQFITENTLAHRFFAGSENLLSIIGRSIAILVIWYSSKFLFLYFLGRIYRIKNFVPGILSLDTVGSYPLVLLLSLPMAFVMFSPKLWGGLWFWLGALILGIYLIRKMYVFYIGLERLFSFSYSMKFLYICAFIILPYIIWF